MAKFDNNHDHSWKYIGDTGVRVCEAPWPFLKSCGRVEWRNDDGKWIEEKKVTKR